MRQQSTYRKQFAKRRRKNLISYFATSFSCCSVTQSCLTLCNSMNCSMPGFLVLYHLLELVQTHIHWVSDAIQPSRPLLSPSPPTFNLQKHQNLVQWVSSSKQGPKVSELQFQHQSFQWIFRIDFLYDWLVWPPCSPRDSQESSWTPQFKSINSLALSFVYSPILTIHRWLLENIIALSRWTFVGTVMSLLFNMLSGLVITFLPRSKRLLISGLKSPSAVILEPPKIKSLIVFPLFPHLFAMKWWDQMPWS